LRAGCRGILWRKRYSPEMAGKAVYGGGDWEVGGEISWNTIEILH
jgi:hypothetical protein